MNILHWGPTFFCNTVRDDRPSEVPAPILPYIRLRLNREKPILNTKDSISVSDYTNTGKGFFCCFFIRADSEEHISFKLNTKTLIPADSKGFTRLHEGNFSILFDGNGSHLSDSFHDINSDTTSFVVSTYGTSSTNSITSSDTKSHNIRIPFEKNKWYFIAFSNVINDNYQDGSMRMFFNGVPIQFMNIKGKSKLNWIDGKVDNSTIVFNPYQIESYCEDIAVDIANFWSCYTDDENEIAKIQDKDFIWNFMDKEHGFAKQLDASGNIDGIAPAVFMPHKGPDSYMINVATGNNVEFSLTDSIDSESGQIKCYIDFEKSFGSFLPLSTTSSFARFYGPIETSVSKFMFAFFVRIKSGFNVSTMCFGNNSYGNFHDLHLRKDYSSQESNRVWWEGQYGGKLIKKSLSAEWPQLLYDKWHFVSGYIDLEDSDNCWFSIDDYIDLSPMHCESSSVATELRLNGLLLFNTTTQMQYDIASFAVYFDSIITANPEIEWSNPYKMKQAFVSDGKMRYIGLSGEKALGFKPSVYINPSAGMGMMSETASGNPCDVQAVFPYSATSSKRVNSISGQDSEDIVY